MISDISWAIFFGVLLGAAIGALPVAFGWYTKLERWMAKTDKVKHAK